MVFLEPKFNLWVLNVCEYRYIERLDYVLFIVVALIFSAAL